MTHPSALDKIRSFTRLLREAMFWSPWKNLKSIVGDPSTFLPPYPWYAEYTLFQPRDWRAVKRLLRFLADMTLLWYKEPPPTSKPIASAAPDLIHTQDTLAEVSAWMGSEEPVALWTKKGRAFPGESWIYVNGIITDGTLAKLNGEYLATLFRRKIKVLHNPTDALVFDVFETLISRLWESYSRADEFVYAHVLTELEKPSIDRVVVIAHSQGTVIFGNVIKKLEETHPNLLYKLEGYTMANCAQTMRQIQDNQDRRVPFLEHFANTQDTVARLGVLAAGGQRRGEVHIDGRVFVRKAFGHLLNTHYLQAVAKRQFAESHGASARLYDYLGGKTPPLVHPPSAGWQVGQK